MGTTYSPPTKIPQKLYKLVRKMSGIVNHCYDPRDHLAVHYFHEESYIARNARIMDPVEVTLRWDGIFDKKRKVYDE
jgi:hypothetical protein